MYRTRDLLDHLQIVISEKEVSQDEEFLFPDIGRACIRGALHTNIQQRKGMQLLYVSVERETTQSQGGVLYVSVERETTQSQGGLLYVSERNSDFPAILISVLKIHCHSCLGAIGVRHIRGGVAAPWREIEMMLGNDSGPAINQQLRS